MKRRETDNDYFSLLRMLDRLARQRGQTIDDASISADLLAGISRAIADHKKNPIRLHGLRAQEMFAHVAASLGRCRAITEEDSGTMFTMDDGTRRPDFRVVTLQGTQFFVEVKNCHYKDPSKAYRIKSAYVTGLQKYSDCMGVPLKFAVYWSRWNIWTLLDASLISSCGRDLAIKMTQAVKLNDMASLGDCMVGTAPPLTVRLYADPTKPRRLQPDDTAPFTISRIEFYAGGERIEDSFEERLAWFFILYGDWGEIGSPAEIVNGDVEYIEFQHGPSEEEDNSQPFSIVGSLSSMISRQYGDSTVVGGNVALLTPPSGPDQLGVLIPEDYKGAVLKLWRFTVRPSTENRHEEG